MKSKDSAEVQQAVKRIIESLPQPIEIRYSPYLLDGVKQASLAMEALRQTIELSSQAVRKFVHDVKLQRQREERLDATGWLPHYTTPFEEISENISPDELEFILEEHYTKNFSKVETEIVARIKSYNLDDEFREVFLQALLCHKVGAYQATSRLLFPEIERVACKEIYGGSRLYISEPSGNDKPRKLKVTSLPDFSKNAKQMPIGEIFSFQHGFRLLDKFSIHLYTIVDDRNIDQVRFDPVPNRHAALHGMVSYNTVKNSINALIMADFIFHLISAMKPYLNNGDETDTT